MNNLQKWQEYLKKEGLEDWDIPIDPPQILFLDQIENSLLKPDDGGE